MNLEPVFAPEPDVLVSGSPEAVRHGCRCPILLNGPAVPAGQRLIAPDCRLHAPLPP